MIYGEQYEYAIHEEFRMRECGCHPSSFLVNWVNDTASLYAFLCMPALYLVTPAGPFMGWANMLACRHWFCGISGKVWDLKPVRMRSRILLWFELLTFCMGLAFSREGGSTSILLVGFEISVFWNDISYYLVVSCSQASWVGWLLIYCGYGIPGRH